MNFVHSGIFSPVKNYRDGVEKILQSGESERIFPTSVGNFAVRNPYSIIEMVLTLDNLLTAM